MSGYEKRDHLRKRLRDLPLSVLEFNLEFRNVTVYDIDDTVWYKDRIVWLIEYSKRSVPLYPPLHGFVRYTLRQRQKTNEIRNLRCLATQLHCGALLIIYDETLLLFGVYDIMRETIFQCDRNGLYRYIGTRLTT